MIAPAPALEVRTYDAADLSQVAALVNRWLNDAPWSVPLDEETARRQWLLMSPRSELGARMQEPLRLCVWRAGEIVGYLDGALGATSESLDLPEHQPEGLIRFLACIPDSESAPEILRLLLQRAETLCIERGVTHLVAFHLSTGFLAFQAGAGILPGEWAEHVRQLTAAKWAFQQRYYALTRQVGLPVEEEYPIGDMSLVQQRTTRGRTYLVYYRRVELIAQAKVLGFQLDRTGTAERVLHLVKIEVNEAWRNRNLGKWLLRRIINDAGQSGFQEMLAFVPMNLPIALNLLIQAGFQEHNYRGYTLEKQIPAQAPDAHPLRYR